MFQLQELDLYKKLKHKHIVGYIDATFEPRINTLFIFLEYVPGGSIQSMLERFGRFGEELTRVYTRQLLMGLEYLHGCQIVHRDVKGANILVSRDGIVKLADFGASKAFRDPNCTDGMKSLRGSPFWIAPEVVRGTGYGEHGVGVGVMGAASLHAHSNAAMPCRTGLTSVLCNMHSVGDSIPMQSTCHISTAMGVDLLAVYGMIISDIMPFHDLGYNTCCLLLLLTFRSSCRYLGSWLYCH